jgi:hypothetical protein
MGLDTSHGCWHGAYSAFSRWRTKLAEVAGVPLPLMEGFWGRGNPYADGIEEIVGRLQPPSPFTSSSDGGFTATRETLLGTLQVSIRMDPDTRAMQAVLHDVLPWLPLSWDSLKSDVLHELLNHSDCDGELAPEICAPLADRLAELLPLMPDEDTGGHIGNWRSKTQTFINGLRLAASKGEPVTFG